MHRRTAVASIIAATWALAACGLNSPDTRYATQDVPRLLVDLQSLPDGHPPVPGFSSRPALPEGHPPVVISRRKGAGVFRRNGAIERGHPGGSSLRVLGAVGNLAA